MGRRNASKLARGGKNPAGLGGVGRCVGDRDAVPARMALEAGTEPHRSAMVGGQCASAASSASSLAIPASSSPLDASATWTRQGVPSAGLLPLFQPR